jgi:hypothetical protein
LAHYSARQKASVPETATVFRQQGPVMEHYSPQLLKALFDPGALESIHR